MSKTIQTPLRWNLNNPVDRECIEWLQENNTQKNGMATLIKSIIVCHVREQKRLQTLNELTKQLRDGSNTPDLASLLKQALAEQQPEKKEPEPQNEAKKESKKTDEEPKMVEDYAQIESDNLPF
jgi:hypothetical protein